MTATCCARARRGAVLGHAVSAPSTLGTFLRAFTFGHVRQLDRVLGRTVWSARGRRAPGRAMSGWSWMWTALSVRSTDMTSRAPATGTRTSAGITRSSRPAPETGEVLHIRARKGSANTSRGALRFVEELIARVARAGATGPKLLRADSGFWNKKIMARLQAPAGRTRSASACRHTSKPLIAAIPEPDWQTLADYPEGGEAQIAQTMLGCQRLIVRRTRLVGAQAELWPDWRSPRILDQPRRRARARRVRTPPTRRRRARDPRPQRPGARALPVRAGSSPTPPGP